MKINEHPLYSRWASMKQRCLNPNHDAYPRYGGRGIKVCDRWLNSSNYVEDIMSEIGPCPGGRYTIDRIDNNGDYEPGNVKWATWKEQSANSRPKCKSVAEIKRCSYCGRFLGRDAFGWNDKKKNYRDATCKKCVAVQSYIYRHSHAPRRTVGLELRKVLNRAELIGKEIGLDDIDTLHMALDLFTIS